MIELYIALLLIPAVAITLWDRMVHRLSVNAKRVYRLTGFIGVPVHELAHAFVCVIFGMRITKISFYQPNHASGTMGFVDFRYSPFSIKHGLGLAVQGVAPLLAGAVIVVFLLGTHPSAGVELGGIFQLITWIVGVAGSTSATAFDIAFSSLTGFVAVVLALIISMHAMPSGADILVGLRGLLMIVVFFAIAVAGLELLWMFESQTGEHISRYMAQVLVWVEKGLWVALFGAVSIVTMAVLSGILLVLVPTGALRLIAFVRGARGKI